MYHENPCKPNSIFRGNQKIMVDNQYFCRPGDVLDGGYFAGVFALGNKEYGLIVSSKKQGEFNDVEWGSYRLDINASSYADGLANTIVMANTGNMMAKKLLQMKINSFNDWYIPARDELELIYRNLKPTNDKNLTSFRDGENPSSIPPGYPYTTTTPAQTEVSAFQLAGEQAMEAVSYWSSTQSSMYAAWTQHFKNGSHHTNHKIGAHNVRAVRRFRISPGDASDREQ